MVVTADLGFAKKGRNFAAGLDAPMAFIEKRRVANDAKAEALTIIGEIKDHDVILVDDEVSTGGSMAQAVELLKANGARNIYMVFVHAALTEDGCQETGRVAGREVHHHQHHPDPTGHGEAIRRAPGRS